MEGGWVAVPRQPSTPAEPSLGPEGQEGGWGYRGNQSPWTKAGGRVIGAWFWVI